MLKRVFTLDFGVMVLYVCGSSKNLSIMTITKFKKGTYYVGDPCYLFDKSWGDVLNETSFFNQNEFRGELVAAGSTSYGDGVYYDQLGREYWVDSGMLGILPISLEAVDNKFRDGKVFKDKGAHVIEFKEDFNVEISAGIFSFGDIIINTQGNDEEEED